MGQKIKQKDINKVLFLYFDQINLLLQQYLCHCVQNLSERNLDQQKKWQEIKKISWGFKKGSLDKQYRTVGKLVESISKLR